MPLAEFGNRIPQLSFEVFRPIAEIEEHVRAVASSGLDRVRLRHGGGDADAGPGETIAENAHARRDVSDWTVSIDELQGSARTSNG